MSIKVHAVDPPDGSWPSEANEMASQPPNLNSFGGVGEPRSKLVNLAILQFSCGEGSAILEMTTQVSEPGTGTTQNVGWSRGKRAQMTPRPRKRCSHRRHATTPLYRTYVHLDLPCPKHNYPTNGLKWGTTEEQQCISTCNLPLCARTHFPPMGMHK